MMPLDSCEMNWKGNERKRRNMQCAMSNTLISFDYPQEEAEKLANELISTIVENQKEYDA